MSPSRTSRRQHTKDDMIAAMSLIGAPVTDATGKHTGVTIDERFGLRVHIVR